MRIGYARISKADGSQVCDLRRAPAAARVGTVILGIVLLGESVNAARLIRIMLIIAGIIGLKLATPA
jgi:uncharacterized membrane protein